MENCIKSVKPSECTGCSACYSCCPKNAIEIKNDKYGFYIPTINEEKCIDCGKCLKVCPAVNDYIKNGVKEVYAVTLKDNDIKFNSSSGGAFFWIASYILSNGGIVYGAEFNTHERIVKHIRVDSMKNLHRLQNSKYVQSMIGETYKQAKRDLAKGYKVLFSGTPCQIAGLYAYVGHQSNLYTCDILCYGVPSPMVLEKYLNEIVDEKEIVSLNMRDKTNGWVNYSMKIGFSDGEYLSDKYKDLYHKGFQTHIFYRESCYSCKYRNDQRPGDITLGDFWNFKESFRKNSIINNDTGISFVMLNNEKGKMLFNLLDPTQIIKEKRQFEENKDNFGFKKDMEISAERSVFFEYLRHKKYTDVIYGFAVPYKKQKVSVIKNMYRKIKKIYFIRKILYKLGVNL